MRLARAPGLWHVALGLVVGAAALWAWWRFMGGPDVLRALRGANRGLLSLGLLALASGQAVRLLRWHVLLRGLGPIGLARTFRTLYASELLNTFLPVKAGDAGRALALSRIPPFTFGSTMATVVADRFYGIFVRLAVTPLALALPVASSRPFLLSAAAFGGVLAVSVVTAFALHRSPRLLAAITRLGLRFVPARFHGPLERAVAEFTSSFVSLNIRPATAIGALLLSFGALGLQSTAVWLFFRSTGASLGPLTALVGTACMDILAVLPAPPAGLGVSEWSVTFVFAFTLGAPRVATSAAALLYHGVWLLLVICLGAGSVRAVGEMLPRVTRPHET